MPEIDRQAAAADMLTVATGADPGRPVLLPVDTTRAREVLNDWLGEYLDTVGHPLPNAAALLSLRGRIAAALTDARLAGRAEGFEAGYAQGEADAL